MKKLQQLLDRRNTLTHDIEKLDRMLKNAKNRDEIQVSSGDVTVQFENPHQAFSLILGVIQGTRGAFTEELERVEQSLQKAEAFLETY